MTKSLSRSKHGVRIAHTPSALKRTLAQWRARRDSVALIPTMGALHDGHFSLIRLAQRRADRVVVSIFVNPAQFAPHEDFKSYPRTFDSDAKALALLKTDLIWAPAVGTMYPPDFSTRIVPQGPALAGLEDASRPHFFAGVATVVGKLLIQCVPDIAVFGEKDFQQLKVVGRLARDLDLPTRIVGAKTVRETDGLALSSRNRYLSASERATAPALYRALAECAQQIAAGEPIAAVLDKGRAAVMAAGFALDYLEARHSETLGPVASLADGPIRLLIAARIGSTRLIDNVAV